MAWLDDFQVMARYIDDVSFSTIRELILLNNVEIIAHIQSDTAFLQRLFEVCYPPTTLDTTRTSTSTRTSTCTRTDGDGW